MSSVLFTHLDSLELESENKLYAPIFDQVRSYFSATPFEGYFPKELLSKIFAMSESTSEDDQLVNALKPLVKIAYKYALCKPSQFPVGGCCYCKESGNAYIGFNMESEKHWIGYSVHAEQCTFNNALIHGEKVIDLLVVSYTPCGHCRQFINQFAFSKTLKIFIVTINKAFNVHDLLPYDFSPADLPEINFPDTDNFCVKKMEGDKVDDLKIEQVIKAAKKSHLDNLANYCAVGLFVKDKAFFGNFLENCAHNPSFHPMNGAISQLVLNGFGVQDVDEIVAVQYENSPFWMKETVLGVIGGYGELKKSVKITYVVV
ncbi:cytidine deaminase, putative [Entamoeba invadens IP1]|uniref:cytidine deaminase, putative n=1 Tax=Entamoeba invadens IP1 TaxID=370355 RepID=UPI0002C3E531|nr:cytidine deaminase, putative [Entamoeba invadens IP1]ELP90536.1 cytidine deaminase, putative [Entamoeba invadens IP1]|eukprot:XP_004257307.1 cytidine deaminase, putative [Entamoeba invadens IP1]